MNLWDYFSACWQKFFSTQHKRLVRERRRFYQDRKHQLSRSGLNDQVAVRVATVDASHHYRSVRTRFDRLVQGCVCLLIGIPGAIIYLAFFAASSGEGTVFDAVATVAVDSLVVLGVMMVAISLTDYPPRQPER